MPKRSCMCECCCLQQRNFGGTRELLIESKELASFRARNSEYEVIRQLSFASCGFDQLELFDA